MKSKLIVLLLLLGMILISGCQESNQPEPEETVTPEEIMTPEETPAPAVTPVETEPEVERTPVVNETDTNETNVSETPASGTGGPAYLIRLNNYRASPTALEINEGGTVSWINLQESPKRAFTLVSEQGLFENTNLVYRRPFAYTFNEPGEYTFTVLGQPKMNVTVTVVEA